MKTLKNTYLLLLTILLGLMSSCTLLMEDEEIPEDELGFGEPYTKTLNEAGLDGYVTYEYQDDVKAITHNVQEFIHHIEADTIVYYFDNTPDKYVPRVGEKLSMESCPKAINGLNHRVLSITKANGFYRVVTTRCGLKEVFKTLDADFTFDVPIPAFIALDSTYMDSVGYTDEDMEVVNWELYNRAYYPEEYAQQQEEERKAVRTRAASGMPGRHYWHSEPLGGKPYGEEQTRATRGLKWEVMDEDIDLGNLSKGTTLPIVNFDSRNTSIKIEAMESTLAETSKVLKALDVFHPYLVASWKYTIVYKLRIKVTLDPRPKITIKKVEQSSWNFAIEYGLELDVSKDDSKELYNKNLKKCIEAMKKASKPSKSKLGLPKIHIPIPFVTPGLTAYIKFRFGVGLTLAMVGSYEYESTTPEMTTISEISFSDDEDDDTPSEGGGECSKGDPEKKTRTETNFSGDAKVSGSIGAEIGLSVAGWASGGAYVDFQVELGVSKEPNETAEVVEYDSHYNPSNRALNFEVHALAGINGGLDFDSDNKLSFEQQIADFTLISQKIHFYPVLREMTVNGLEYDKDTWLLKSFTTNFDFKYDGLIDSYKRQVAPAVVAKSATTNESRLFVGDVIDELKTDKTYSMKCDLDPQWWEEAQGVKDWKLYPGLVLYNDDEEKVQILGVEDYVVGSLEGANVEIKKREQTFGNPTSQLSSTFYKKMQKKYDKYGRDISKYQIFGFHVESELSGAVNVDEWGYDISIEPMGYSAQPLEFNVPFESRNTNYISRGKKSMDITFLDKTDPQFFFDSEVFKVTIVPYARLKSGKRQKYHRKTLILTYPIGQAAVKTQENNFNKRLNGEGSRKDVAL